MLLMARITPVDPVLSVGKGSRSGRDSYHSDLQAQKSLLRRHLRNETFTLKVAFYSGNLTGIVSVLTEIDSPLQE